MLKHVSGYLSRLFLCLIPVLGIGACSNSNEPLVCLPLSEANQTVNIKGGAFKFGDNRYYPDEGPVKIMSVADFNIDKTEVTNSEFLKFVDATGYVTAVSYTHLRAHET